MIGYITLGSNELNAAGKFYDGLLAPLGASRAYTLDTMIAYGFGPQKPMLVITSPLNGGPATGGNGTMVALMAKDAEQVRAVHETGLKLGAECDGPPAIHAGQHYGGYLRDRDGNKLCVFVMVNQPEP